MEDVEGIRTDSPTVVKGNINIPITQATMKGWKNKTCEEMQKLGCKKTFLDPAMFLFCGGHRNRQDEE